MKLVIFFKIILLFGLAFLVIANLNLSFKRNNVQNEWVLSSLQANAQGSGGETSPNCVEYRTNDRSYIQFMPTQCCATEVEATTCWDFVRLGTNCPQPVYGTVCESTISYRGTWCCG